MKIFKYSLLSLATVLFLLCIFLYSLYGGGEKWEFSIPKPLLTSDKLELVADFNFPPGNIGVSKENRVFITIHPESKPETLKVVEIVDGKPIAFPDLDSQKKLYSHPQGVRIDYKNRVCTIDHGDNGFQNPRLVCVSLITNKAEIDYRFPRESAPILSYLQDFANSPDSRYYYIADVNFFGKKPALVVYDSETKTSHRFLENHPSMKPENWKIQAHNGPMERLGGLITLKAGVDSIATDAKGEWVYYGPMNHRKLFRIPAKVLQNFSGTDAEVATAIEEYSDKILSDGIILDASNNIYLTDVEHQSIGLIDPNRNLKTLVVSPKLRWPDGLAISADGTYLYIADSDIPNVALMSKSHIQSKAPYQVFRVKLPKN